MFPDLSVQEFVNAVNAEMPSVMPGEVFFEDWQPSRKRQLPLSVEEIDAIGGYARRRMFRRPTKRQRQVDAELDWLDSNQLFRGSRPFVGERWVDYNDRISKRRRDDEEGRAAKRLAGAFRLPEEVEPVISEVQVEPDGSLNRPVIDNRPVSSGYGPANLPVNPDYYSNPFSSEAIEDMLSKTRESPFYK